MTETPAQSQPRVGNATAPARPADRARAFRALYDAQLSYVWRSVKRLGARDADVEDLAHETFVRAYQKFETYDPSRPVKPWLFGIAFRVVSEHRRLAMNDRESLAEDDAVPDRADDAPDVVTQLQSAESRALVAEALGALSLPHRGVFVMTELDGLSAPEIAEALQIPLNTVYSRLRKARFVFTEAVRSLASKRGFT